MRLTPHSGQRHSFYLSTEPCGCYLFHRSRAKFPTPSNREFRFPVRERSGNPTHGSVDTGCVGSIPAQAGEPATPLATRPRAGVYPRPCGGTSARTNAYWFQWGLSPPRRGNPRPGQCTGIERMLDCPLDFATRNGPVARPPGPQATPLRGAFRVHNLSTPTGCAWKTLARFPHRSCDRSISSSVYLKFVHTGTAALRWPLLLHHSTGWKASPENNPLASKFFTPLTAKERSWTKSIRPWVWTTRESKCWMNEK